MKMRNGFKALAVILICTLCVGTTVFAQTGSVSGNTPTVSGDVPSGSVSGNEGSTTVNATGSGEAEAAVVENKVVTADGKTLTSTSAVMFTATGIKGAVPTAAKADVDAAAGITAGETAKFYIGNVYKKDVKAALKAAAAEVNGTVVTMLDLDLYKLSKNGIQAVKTPAAPIEMVIALPGRVSGKTVSLVGVFDGKVVELQDKDTDDRTLTVDLANFGAYALVVK